MTLTAFLVVFAMHRIIRGLMAGPALVHVYPLNQGMGKLTLSIASIPPSMIRVTGQA
jgi:hypothetical protein